LKGILWGGVFGLLLLITLPFWMGIVLKTAIPEDLVTIGDYQTSGYGRFGLSEIEVTSPGIKVQVDRFEAPSLLNWGYRAMTGGFDDFVVEMGSIVVDVSESDGSQADSEGEAPKDIFEAIAMLEEPLGLASIWLPSARIEKVVINLEGQFVELREILWKDLRLEFESIYSQRPESVATIAVNLTPGETAFSIRVPNEFLSLSAVLGMDAEVVTLRNEILFKENRLLLNADFGKKSWVPVFAEWKADSWEVVGEDFGVDVLYSDYRFNFGGKWEDGKFSSSADGSARVVDPVEDLHLPTVDFVSSFSGDGGVVNIDAFSLKAPGMSAAIKEAVSFDFASKRMEGNVFFDIDFDLSLLKVESLMGALVGTLRLEASEEGTALGHFELAGREIAYRDYRIDTLDLDTNLAWPRLEVTRAEAVFNEGSTFDLSGVFDLEGKRTEKSSVRGRFDSAFLERFLPVGVSVEGIDFEVVASGPFAETSHGGRLAYGILDTPTLKPLTGEAEWDGKGTLLEMFSMTGDNGDAAFSMKGKGGYKEQQIDVTLEDLVLERGGQPVASLMSPARVEVKTGESVEAALADFTLSGAAGEIALGVETRFPDSAKISATIKNLDTGNWHDPWVKTPAGSAEIRYANLDASWNRGPVIGKAAMDAWLTVGSEPVFLKGDLEVVREGVEIGGLQISDSSGPLFGVVGKIPYAVSSTVDGWVSVEEGGELSLEMESKDSPTLLALLGDVLPFELDEFDISGQLGGTIEDPSGAASLKMKTRAGEGEHGLPSADIEFAGALAGPEVTLSRIELGVLEQRFAASGAIFFQKEVLSYLLLEEPDVDWAGTRFEFEVPDSSIAPIAFFAPEFLRADGGLNGKLEGSLSGGIDGRLSLKGVNTRPIFPFGSLREISTELVFKENEMKLEAFSGQIGREPLQMEGKLDYGNFEEPKFALKIFGENLPMLRQPGLLQRADLDLMISRESADPATVSGTVNLEEGLFLLDTSVLAGGSSGGGRSAESRPPYFAVDVPPVDDWKLDVVLKGERFINLQTPAATGELSMDMVLKGTMAEPFLRGRVIYEEGFLVFPFASFGIEQGLVEIRTDDPYTPLLSITGEARRLGYDLAVEITGSAFDPQIRFSSSPPLTSEQILLMVMAGENPNDNFSYSASQRASKIGSYLSKGLFSSGGSGGGIGSRLSISSGENLSRQGKETMEVEVLLDERFQMVGEYDEYDAWNGGIRWKIFGRRNSDKDKEVKGE